MIDGIINTIDTILNPRSDGNPVPGINAEVDAMYRQQAEMNNFIDALSDSSQASLDTIFDYLQ